MDMEPDLEIEIQFGEGPPGIKGRPVMDTLTLVLDRVKEVIGKF